MDADEILNALENNKNEDMMKLSYKKELRKKNLVFDDLHLNLEEREKFFKKLENYIYVDDIPSIHHGSFIRWIPLKDPDKIYLTKGGHVCDVNICEKGSYVICKCQSFKKPIFLQVKMDEAFIFRKLNYQETILLEVIKYLENKN